MSQRSFGTTHQLLKLVVKPKARFSKRAKSLDDYYFAEDMSGYQNTSSHVEIKPTLKKLEKSLDPAHFRIITSYQDNYSAALQLPISRSDLEKKAAHLDSLIDCCSENIIEHAARRVDLFFYTLVAYYNTQISPELGTTRLQHGIGRQSSEFIKITQACHSHLLPTLLDQTIEAGVEKSILSQTHLMDNLNSTMELPSFVNELDDALENATHCREKSLKILNAVAQGKQNPIEGLNAFLKMLHGAFALINEKKQLSRHGTPYLLRNTLESPQKIKERLVVLQEFGTFHQKWSTKGENIHYPYTDLLLRLTPKEITDCDKGKRLRHKVYLKKIAALQQEILTTKTAFDPRAHSVKPRPVTD